VLLKVLDDLRHADIRPTGIELSGDEFPSLFGNARKQTHSRILFPRGVYCSESRTK
jgi:hypothetical protein